VKIHPNEAFGFLRITVERPLRQRWEISDATIAAAQSARGLAKQEDVSAETLLDALRSAIGTSTTDRRVGAKTIDTIAQRCGLTTPQTKALWDALAARDVRPPRGRARVVEVCLISPGYSAGSFRGMERRCERALATDRRVRVIVRRSFTGRGGSGAHRQRRRGR